VPPLPRIHNPELASLAADLRFGARAAILREIERAEALASEIDPGATYPAEWVIYRVTGYRPDHAGEGLIEGAQLSSDLSAFVERLCASVEFREHECPEGSLGLDELAVKLNVSRKTVDRWRRSGLVARRARTEGGRDRLLVTPAAFEAFERAHKAVIERASGASRIDPAIASRMIRRAARYRRGFGCTRNQAAVRLSRRFGHSLEGVRRLLERHDAAERARPGGAPIFDPPKRPGGRQRAAALRAALVGEQWQGVARAMGEPGASKRRAARVVLGQRLRILRRLDLSGPIAADFDTDRAHGVYLSPDAVRIGLGAADAHESLGAQLDAARSLPPPDREAERVRAAAMHSLRWRAWVVLAGIGDPSGAASAVDEIETMLRWAGLLRVELVRAQMATVVKTLDALPGGLGSMRPGTGRDVLARALAEAGRAADRFSPFRGARLAGSVSMALGPLVTRLEREGDRASRARQALSSVDPVGTLDLRPSVFWRPTLTAPGFVVRALDALGEREAVVLRARWGLGGAGPPLTLDGLAAELGTTRMRAAMAERAALRAAGEVG